MSVRRWRGLIEVTGTDALPGWTFRYSEADGSMTAVPAEGGQITPALWRRVPVGTVLAAVRAITATTTIAAAAEALPPVDEAKRRDPHDPAHQAAVARDYRAALAAGVAPRDLIAHRWQVDADTAGRWARIARQAGVLADVHTEKRQIRESK